MRQSLLLQGNLGSCKASFCNPTYPPLQPIFPAFKVGAEAAYSIPCLGSLGTFASLVTLAAVGCVHRQPAAHLFLLKTEVMRPQSCGQVSGASRSRQCKGTRKRSLPLDGGGSGWGGVGRVGLQSRDLAPNQGPLRTYLMQTTHPLSSSTFPKY